MEKANIFGQMDLPTWGTLWMETERERANGFPILSMEIYMQDFTKETKRKERANIYGIKDAYLKVSSRQI